MPFQTTRKSDTRDSRAGRGRRLSPPSDADSATSYCSNYSRSSAGSYRSAASLRRQKAGTVAAAASVPATAAVTTVESKTRTAVPTTTTFTTEKERPIRRHAPRWVDGWSSSWWLPCHMSDRNFTLCLRIFLLVVCVETLIFNLPKSAFKALKPLTGDVAAFVSGEYVEYAVDICFVTSVYARNRYVADKVPPAKLRDEAGFRHFLFTNLDNLNSTGWEPIVMSNFTYSRMITQSRWGKFMAWQSPIIQDSCDVVFYIDGIYETKAAPAAFRSMARHILESNSWMQQRHTRRKGILDEIQKIQKARKDTPSNLEVTVNWLTNQTDFNPNATVYENTWFGYSPRSPAFQNLTLEFWKEYAKEETSWRDQPLWAYFVSKNKLKLLDFPRRTKYLFQQKKSARGFGDHKYVEDNDQNIDQNLPICFITSVYAPDISVADTVPAAELRSEPNIRHFLFTNLPSLRPLGWTPILLTNLTYDRMITRSRYAKFMAWHFPIVRESCKVVFYMDGAYETVGEPLAYRRLAHKILNASNRVLMQYPHNRKRNLIEELRAIESEKKDTADNVAKTLDWFQAQPEFCPNCTVYLNTFFGYNPNNAFFQNFTTEFWNEYAAERTSWRDQPLWAHFIFKNRIKPLNFTFPTSYYFREIRSSRGFGDHTYVEQDDHPDTGTISITKPSLLSWLRKKDVAS